MSEQQLKPKWVGRPLGPGEAVGWPSYCTGTVPQPAPELQATKAHTHPRAAGPQRHCPQGASQTTDHRPHCRPNCYWPRVVLD